MTIRWYGLVAPEEAPTGDRRMFAAQALDYRDFPLPAAWQRVSGSGHAGSVVVASWNRQYSGEGGIWASGEFLDPAVVPEAIEAMYLLQKKLIGPSVDLDPDLTYEVVPHPDNPDEFAMKVTKATVHGLTFVMSPAFPQVHITVDNDEEMAVLASAGIEASFAVNSTAWNSFPLAPRETKFDHDTAVDRIAVWSGGDAKKYGSAFLWKDDEGNPLSRETYRLPVIDIINDKAYLIPRAVFSAGVIMSGGHGGLYDTLSEEQRIKVQQVVTDIYDMLRETYADPRVVAPWQRGGRQGADSEVAEPTRASLDPNHYSNWLPEEVSMISEELDAYISARVAALVAIPATDGGALTAAGVLKPADYMFAAPAFRKPTPLTVDEDGHVYGHLATWKQCHMAVGNKCQIAPRSKTNYGFFRQGSVLTASGKTIRVGKITIGTGHADKAYGVIPAAEHYDNTGTCVAVVNAGEDSFGVWVAGAVVDGVSEPLIAALRRSPLSGDWRRVNGNLELVAALAVNSPGFPVLHEDSGGEYSLTAAGVLTEQYGTVDESPASTEVTDPSVRFAEVDRFLGDHDRAVRAESINAMFHDLLPVESDCGCNG